MGSFCYLKAQDPADAGRPESDDQLSKSVASRRELHEGRRLCVGRRPKPGHLQFLATFICSAASVRQVLLGLSGRC